MLCLFGPVSSLDPIEGGGLLVRTCVCSGLFAPQPLPTHNRETEGRDPPALQRSPLSHSALPGIAAQPAAWGGRGCLHRIEGVLAPAQPEPFDRGCVWGAGQGWMCRPLALSHFLNLNPGRWCVGGGGGSCASPSPISWRSKPHRAVLGPPGGGRPTVPAVPPGPHRRPGQGGGCRGWKGGEASGMSGKVSRVLGTRSGGKGAPLGSLAGRGYPRLRYCAQQVKPPCPVGEGGSSPAAS